MAETLTPPRRPEPARPPGREPPHSLEAEAYLLGCCLLDGSESIARCIEAKLAGTAFYSPANRVIFEKLVELYQKSPPVGVEVLAEELRTARQLDAVGGFAYLSQLANNIPTTAQAQYFIDKVKELSLLRELITVATGTVESCLTYQGGIEDFIDKVEQDLFRVTQGRIVDAAKGMKETTTEAVAVINKMLMKKGELTGVATGFHDLDMLTWGLQKQEMIVLAARPSLGKCLAEDSELVLSDGSIATIGELYGRKSAALLTLGSDLKLRATEPSDYVDDGRKPVYRVTTRLGRRVEATAPHPFLTLDGWRPLMELRVGERVAVPRVMPVFGSESARDCEVKLLAYLTGDGTLTRTCVQFTNSDPRLRDEFAECVEVFGDCKVRLNDSHGTRTETLRVSTNGEAQRFRRGCFAEDLAAALERAGLSQRQLAEYAGVSPSLVTQWTKGKCAPGKTQWPALESALGALAHDPEAISKNTPNAIARWIEGLGLNGKKAADKFVPAFVFRLNCEQLALYLNRLFATDGWASVSKGGANQIGYCSASERLVRQVAHLLLRFGVLATVSERRVRYRGEKRTYFGLSITDQESLLRFANDIGIFGKEEAVGRVRTSVLGKTPKANNDLIPKGIWSRIDSSRNGESWASLARRAGLESWTNIHVGQRGLSRGRLAKIAGALGDRSLNELSNSDVYWDEIVSIEPVGLKQVYDLTIPKTHNFVSNDICVHNTSLALNMAESAALPKKGDPVPVLFFSLEMSAAQLAMRLICSRARVNMKLLREGLLPKTGNDYQRILAAADDFSKAPIFIDDSSHLSIMELRAKARRVHSRRKLGFVVVDYLQLLSPTDSQTPREQQVAEASRGLKALAKELDVPVLVLSQLNRSSEKENRAPKLADLRESGSIEQDADVVLMLARPKDADEKFQTAADSAELIVAKQRNGPVGELKLTFLREFTRFENHTA